MCMEFKFRSTYYNNMDLTKNEELIMSFFKIFQIPELPRVFLARQLKSQNCPAFLWRGK